MVRRLVALFGETTISEELVRPELAPPTASAPGVATASAEGPADDEAVGTSLGGAVERHLNEYFDSHVGSLPASGLYGRVLAEIERPLIRLCLAATRGNQLQAAKLLGINRNTLRKKIRQLDLQVTKGMD